MYKNNIEHLLEELNRIDLIISLNLEKWRAEHNEDLDGFQGLYISENEVNAILQTQPFELKVDISCDSAIEKIEILTRQISRKKTESIKQAKELRLHLLSELFNLQPFETDAILICLAPELDLRYEKLYSYLQNDVTRKRPTVDLVIKLLCYSIEDRLKAREYFSLTAPLIKNGLICFTGDNQLPLLSRSIKTDDRIISFLLEKDGIDQRIREFSAIIRPGKSLNDLILTEENKNTLIKLIKWHLNIERPMMFFFHGPYGTGKKTIAEAVCRESGTSLFVVDSKALKGVESAETLNLILREALLQGASLYFEGFSGLLEKDTGVNMINMVRELDQFPNWVFLSGELPWEPASVLRNHGFISYAVPISSFTLRKLLWEAFLKSDLREDVDVGALAGKFKFSGGQIRDAIFTARNIARTKKPDEPKLSMEELYQGCKIQSSRNLSTLAKKIEPHYTWEDIVLPEDTKDQLKEVSGYIKHRGTVYTDWGFDRKLSLGKGLNVLFSGPPGTGKTMAAEVIASELHLDIYKIDLSQIVSKYIGETEKNLDRIFTAAENANAILFFDEADALFGKRSEVKDAHDRYANIEIGYLLQKMEEYEGISILATNLRQNMDEAFMRRMQVVVEFPFPDEEYRRRIWEVTFPQDTPLGDDVDLNMLAREVKLAGGNIKNIALAAAFYAAEESGAIRMGHLIHAARREYQKLGQAFIEGKWGAQGIQIT